MLKFKGVSTAMSILTMLTLRFATKKTLHIIDNDENQPGTIMRGFNIIVTKMWHLGLNTIILIWIWSCENLRFGFIQVLVLSHTLLHQNLKRAARFANEWCSANVSHKIPHQRNGCHVISAICVRGPGNDSFKLNMWKGQQSPQKNEN